MRPQHKSTKAVSLPSKCNAPVHPQFDGCVNDAYPLHPQRQPQSAGLRRQGSCAKLRGPVVGSCCRRCEGACIPAARCRSSI